MATRNEELTVWERPQPARRPVAAKLTRESIVKAAMKLADKEGLDAVSLRNVGAALGAGAMRLYGYVDTKDELLELMVDEVFGAIVEHQPLKARGLRKVLTAIAEQLRWAARRHPWFVELLAGRNPIGPHALAYLEATLAALRAELRGADEAMQALRVVKSFALGALHTEAGELRARVQTGKSKDQWRMSYLQRALAGGKLPTVAEFVRDGRHPSDDAAFDEGLEYVIAGLEAKLISR